MLETICRQNTFFLLKEMGWYQILFFSLSCQTNFVRSTSDAIRYIQICALSFSKQRKNYHEPWVSFFASYVNVCQVFEWFRE